MSSRLVFRSLVVAVAMGGLVVSASAQAVKRAVPLDENGNPIPQPDAPPAQPDANGKFPPLPPLPPPLMKPEEAPLPVKRAEVVPEPAPNTPVMRAVPVEEPAPAPAEPAKPKSETTKNEEPKKEDKPRPKPTPPPKPEKPEFSLAEIPDATLISMRKQKRDLEASWKTSKDARTVKLEVAAPRGQIVDRNGVCLARNRMDNYLSVSFASLPPTTKDEAAVAFGRAQMDEANKRLGKKWGVTDEELAAHFKNRRQLPLIFSKDPDNDNISVGVTAEEIQKIRDLLGKGLILSPTFVRAYPKLDTACQVLGYAGIVRKLPTGPIIDGEPLIEELTGRSGLEMAFESDLRGKPGLVNILFDGNGQKLHEEVLRRPVPGHNIVTTLDYDFQRFAEDALREHAENGGAMVIMDVRNGDILAMASYPTFDPNDFSPRISAAKYAALSNNPKHPLNGRAFQGAYFPASTFKVVTALASLESGAVKTDTYFDCSSSYQIGDRAFHNWNKEGEGAITVVDAIKRSCNTWFYQAALQTGSGPVIAMAERMGFGQPTGLPIPEYKGFVPTDAYYQQTERHKILPGQLASICIGQVVTATPLQVVQCMASVADGVNMPKVRLVKQVQDYNDNVVKAWAPEVRKQLNLSKVARDAVVKGMVAVVNGDRGTGHAAQIEGIKVAGKTGTAQWIVDPNGDRDKSKWLAWFTGFLPAENPVYAFAVVYEGRFGQSVSGGAVAAPIVHSVLQKIHDNEKAGDPIKSAIDMAPRAEVVADTPPETSNAAQSVPVGDEPPPSSTPPPPPAEENRGVKGFFRKLFGR